MGLVNCSHTQPWLKNIAEIHTPHQTEKGKILCENGVIVWLLPQTYLLGLYCVGMVGWVLRVWGVGCVVSWAVGLLCCWLVGWIFTVFSGSSKSPSKLETHAYVYRDP